MKNATVQLNGKTYDAITGALIVDVAIKSVAKSPTAVVPSAQKAPTPHIVTKAVTAPQKTVATPSKITVQSTPTSSHHSHEIAVHSKRTPQTSQTLMRKAVKKPVPGLKKTLHVQTPLAKRADQVLVKKISVGGVDQGRLFRAKHVEKHTQVERYVHAPTGPAIQFAHVPVRMAPEEPNTKPEEVGAPAPKPSNDPVDIFERAVTNANHYVDVHARHKTYKRKARAHFASVTAGAFAVLLIAGFAAYQNLPGVQLSIAGVRAGVATAAPDFAASGFAYSGVTAQDGKRIIGFTNDNGQYQLIQQSTNWSNDDMIKQVSSVSASGEPTYSTVQAGNDTIYRLSNTQATWVKNGVWYQVTGTSVLNDNQLAALAQNS